MRRQQRRKKREVSTAPLGSLAIKTSIDLSTAVLLLTGQVTTVGVFVVPDGIFVSVTGPILGGTRLVGKSAESNAALDAIDIIVGLLMIIGQITVYGPFITARTIFLALTGPIMGINDVPVAASPTEIDEAFSKSLRTFFTQQFTSNDG